MLLSKQLAELQEAFAVFKAGSALAMAEEWTATKPAPSATW
jgi:hypothetical protein